ncbi:FAD-binding oxidoreductase [Aminobacter anthyllidis]|nr:FAD-binding oxidoreductase [Aminobacter anthyllidis]MDH4984176.1 FAD-binding oxidoreductase [Aminobacter anthyllidis]
MMDGISITFADGEVMSFAPTPGGSVLTSAEQAGNALAHSCREGTCRTCVARRPNGDEVLLCVEPAQSGFEAVVPYRRADVSPPTLRRAKINSFQKLSRSVWEIRYRLQFPLPFLPGQFVEATFPGIDGPRRFSMANGPAEAEQILHVRDFPGGAMADYLATRAKPQDAFTVRGPFGIFYLRANPKPKLFVAGGTGLAPIIAMLRGIDRLSSPPLSLVLGFADEQDAYAIDQLKVLANELPLEIVMTADTANPGWSGKTGNPVAGIGHVTGVPLQEGTEAYLCGPPGMVGAARKALRELGLHQDDIFNEEFVHQTLPA